MFSSPKKVQPQLGVEYPVLPTAGGDLLASVLGCGSDAGVRVGWGAVGAAQARALSSRPSLSRATSPILCAPSLLPSGLPLPLAAGPQGHV